MNFKMPHIAQYQGSKRKLAPQILPYLPRKFNRMVEPFAGMAALTIAVAHEHRANTFLINDLNPDICGILKTAVETPDELIAEYGEIWQQQFVYEEGSEAHYYHIREQFNRGNRTAARMLYLLARCVKGSVRYNAQGEFNQSPDKRRPGTKPQTLAENIKAISYLLKGKTEFYSQDFTDILEMARPGDLVYLDPPYQGVSGERNRRYISGLDVGHLIKALNELNTRGIDFVLSYDGQLGERKYGVDLPSSLNLTRININAGLSTQALFLGKKLTTYEALYLSPGLSPAIVTENQHEVQYRLAL